MRQDVVLHAGDRSFLRRHGGSHRAELGLAALALHHHQQHFGHIHRHLLAMVLGHDRQGQVDTRSDAARGNQPPVLQIDAIGLDDGAGKRLDQPLGVVPMGGHAVPVEQTCVAEHKSAGADRAKTPSPWRRSFEPGQQRGVAFVIGAGAARHQQQVISRLGLFQQQVGLHAHAIGGLQRTGLSADGQDLVVVGRRQVAVGNRKHFQRPGHVEQQEVREQRHGHGFHKREMSIEKECDGHYGTTLTVNFKETVILFSSS